MQLTDEIHIAAPRDRVFAALNDPDVLRRCIPGCESLDKTGENEFAAVVNAKVGPVRAKFKGQVTLSDLNPPHSYKITGEGKGGAAGFAKGGADMVLEEQGGETLLKYDVKADVGGKLAQLGSRLIDGTAKSQARDFFSSFKQIVETGSEADVTPAQEHDAAPEAVSAAETGHVPGRSTDGGKFGRTAMWVLAGVIALVAIYVLVT